MLVKYFNHLNLVYLVVRYALLYTLLTLLMRNMNSLGGIEFMHSSGILHFVMEVFLIIWGKILGQTVLRRGTIAKLKRKKSD